MIHTLPQQQREIGCNRIYERRAVDHVCVFDPQMFPVVDTGPFQLWCRNGQSHPHYRQVPYALRLQPHNSGVMAIHLAIHLKWDHAYILGCDWGVSNVSTFDYGRRNSVLKYTNSQKAIVRELKRSISLTVVNNAEVDLDCDRIPVDRFLDLAV